ncbi:hypothetical protein PPTG_18380 [Phytophthora nicotianae INRA-310]|uniref:Uncharacterized protein n=2 Tax=Phytophthora nicotianae TaxID=4792 RepID=W2PG34_PHYN3|nr:hypothetical protein PPTG_18380 [Phytophthora nicotianae INRA-310]ETM99997.1 hypothetical protein PPTG_18380 [Phytophthora nicotianae INRA-310]
MSEVVAFPALARAKKLFLLRKQAARRREGECRVDPRSRDVSSSNNPKEVQDQRYEPHPTVGLDSTRRCTSSLIAFCSDFDEQLRVVNSDLLLLNTSVRREYQRESLALEKLTTELLDKELPSPANQRDVRSCRVRLRLSRPSIKLRVVRQSPPQNSNVKQTQTSPKKPLSRAALLAHQAMKARVLQSYARLYLFRVLYRGGPSQLVAARQLATRCRRSHAFRHWRRVVIQRLKLRRRCLRTQQRIERCVASWARSRAIQVVNTEGKYAMAKEFHQSKLLASSFRTWLGWYQSSGPT